MSKKEGSRKLISLYVFAYSFIVISAIIGANLNKISFAKDNQIVDNLEALVQEDNENAREELGYSFVKKYNYMAVTYIDEVTDEQTSDNKAEEAIDTATDIAKSILDGSLVDKIVKKSNFLIDTSKISFIKFSGDMKFENTIVSGDVAIENINASSDIVAENAVFSGDLLVIEPEEGSENIIIEEPVEIAVEEIIDEKTEEVPALDENGVPTNYVSYIDCTATAYCLCQKCTGKTPNSPGYGRTASGHVIKPGQNEKIIAVDRRQIALGTNVYVQGLNGAPSYGFALAADTGGAIKGNKIDLYYDSHADCLKWGRRQVRVYILP